MLTLSQIDKFILKNKMDGCHVLMTEYSTKVNFTIFTQKNTESHMVALSSQ